MLRRAVSVARAAVFIAHRLSTVIPPDEILVLAKGGTMECGMHRPFLAHNEQHAVVRHRQQVAICEARLAVAERA